MANLQVRLGDDLKAQADALFASLGFDTSTAVRIFLTAAVEQDGSHPGNHRDTSSPPAFTHCFDISTCPQLLVHYSTSQAALTTFRR